MMHIRYPVSAPTFHGKEHEYVLDCVKSTWISSKGPYIDRFETEFAAFCGAQHAVVCSSGTTALHLALMVHGVHHGDEVIVPTMTFVATANAVTYCGATPVFVDIDADTWNLDVSQVEARITPRTKGIIPVHLYGHPADMDAICDFAGQHGLFVLEDAAEAIGATYQGQMVGTLGHSGVFSLFGNKIITAGEGGVVTTDDAKFAATVRRLRDQGMTAGRRYFPSVIGYNYRMTNLQAAIGCAQLEQVDWHIEQRRRVARAYRRELEHCTEFVLPVEKPEVTNVYWMFSVVLRDATAATRDELMRRLAMDGIETRPFFYPMHVLPPYASLSPDAVFPVADKVSAAGINLPTYAALTLDDIHQICDALVAHWRAICQLSQSRGQH